MGAITQAASRDWLRRKSAEYPLQAVHPKPIDPDKVRIGAPFISAVIDRGERVFAFQTEAGRQAFLNDYPLAKAIP